MKTEYDNPLGMFIMILFVLLVFSVAVFVVVGAQVFKSLRRSAEQNPASREPDRLCPRCSWNGYEEEEIRVHGWPYCPRCCASTYKLEQEQQPVHS